MNREAERKRLAELANKQMQDCRNANCGFCGFAGFGRYPECQANMLAAKILADGWMRPPCKVGDTVYRIIKMSTGITSKIRAIRKKGYTTGKIQPCEPTIKQFIRCVTVTKNNIIDCCENYGKTVFTSREDAEKALKGSAGE